MYTRVVVKAYKAKCLKHLTAARLAIEHETDDLIRQLSRPSIARCGARQVRSEVLTVSDDLSRTDHLDTPPPNCSPDQGNNVVSMSR